MTPKKKDNLLLLATPGSLWKTIQPNGYDETIPYISDVSLRPSSQATDFIPSNSLVFVLSIHKESFRGQREVWVEILHPAGHGFIDGEWFKDTAAGPPMLQLLS